VISTLVGCPGGRALSVTTWDLLGRQAGRAASGAFAREWHAARVRAGLAAWYMAEDRIPCWPSACDGRSPQSARRAPQHLFAILHECRAPVPGAWARRRIPEQRAERPLYFAPIGALEEGPSTAEDALRCCAAASRSGR
jgi:hypothetical protein